MGLSEPQQLRVFRDLVRSSGREEEPILDIFIKARSLPPHPRLLCPLPTWSHVPAFLSSFSASLPASLKGGQQAGRRW